MLNQLVNFSRDQKFILACSGGVDSMAIASFYRKGNKDFVLAYFNHGTEQANNMEEFTRKYAKDNFIEYASGKISKQKSKSESKEEHWRNERYAWLKSFNLPIVTCHHLNDAVETWVFTSLNGNPKVISVVNDNIYRPFLANTKEDMISWCTKNNVPWIEDQSNKDISFPRNRIRHVIMPEIMKINPGIEKTIKKKILSQIK